MSSARRSPREQRDKCSWSIFASRSSGCSCPRPPPTDNLSDRQRGQSLRRHGGSVILVQSHDRSVGAILADRRGSAEQRAGRGVGDGYHCSGVSADHARASAASCLCDSSRSSENDGPIGSGPALSSRRATHVARTLDAMSISGPSFASRWTAWPQSHSPSSLSHPAAGAAPLRGRRGHRQCPSRWRRSGRRSQRDSSEYVATLISRHSVRVQPQVDGHVMRINVVVGRSGGLGRAADADRSAATAGGGS